MNARRLWGENQDRAFRWLLYFTILYLIWIVAWLLHTGTVGITIPIHTEWYVW